MDLYLLAELKTISLKVSAICICRRLPNPIVMLIPAGRRCVSFVCSHSALLRLRLLRAG